MIFNFLYLTKIVFYRIYANKNIKNNSIVDRKYMEMALKNKILSCKVFVLQSFVYLHP